LAIGGVKDAVYIANLFLPLKAKLENMVNEYVSTLFNSYWLHKRSELTLITLVLQGNSFNVVVEVVYFDGASNVQKACAILEQRYAMISLLCAAEHNISLFFDNSWGFFAWWIRRFLQWISWGITLLRLTDWHLNFSKSLGAHKLN
jgi:hypothetical protein